MSPAGEGPNQPDGEISPEERAEFKRRSAELGRRLNAARPESETETKQKRARDSASHEVMGRALRLSTELIGGVLVGAALGWWLDTYLMPTAFGVKTWPLMFIVFFPARLGCRDVECGAQRNEDENRPVRPFQRASGSR
jgi:ATP synthase protein I